MQLIRRRRVGARRDPVGLLDDHDPRAEAREDLRELEADRPAAYYEQRLGQLGELQRGDVVDPADLVEALDRRDGGPRAGGDQDPFGGERSPVHLNRVWIEEGAGSVERLVAGAAQPLHPDVA